jgi:hypothetical protein
MKAMSDMEFIVEATERLCPKSEWHGDSHLDNGSLANIDTQEEMLRVVWENLFRDLVVYGQEHNASAQAIMQRKKEALMTAFARMQDTLGYIGMSAEIHHNEEEKL